MDYSRTNDFAFCSITTHPCKERKADAPASVYNSGENVVADRECDGDQNWPALARPNERDYGPDTARMENPRDGIWIIGADARTTYVNERMPEMLGTSRSEMIGQPSFAYLFPTDVEAAQRLLDVKKSGGAKPFRFRLRRTDGTALGVDVQGTPMRDTVGEFVGIVGTFSVPDNINLARI